MKLNKIKRIKKLNKKKRFKYTFKFSNNDTNKFILLLKKGVYPYEYKNDGESLMTQHYLKKENFIAT